MEQSIRGDLSVRVVVDTKLMPWSASPSGTVWRKRLHLVGPAESGQVTSVVRFQERSRFPSHGHPDGEEILVLSGVFSDELGDWPAGSYLLNPQGFEHSPHSADGCVLFVKLRQYPGTDRRHLAVDTRAMPWAPLDGGCARKLLYSQPGYQDAVRLERWPAGTALGESTYPRGAELFLLDGSFEDEFGRYDALTWLRLPAHFTHRPATQQGCELYIKEGGFEYLRSTSA